MKSEEGEYIGYDGKKMFMRGWMPDETPRALVIGIHGLGSHSGLLSFIGESYANRGYAFMAPDLRGFGHYDGIKGHVESFREIIEDVNGFVAEMKDGFEGVKTFMHGHSFGGLVTVHYAAKYSDQLNGILIPCPAVSERLEMGRATRAIVGMLSKVNVKNKFDMGLNLDLISRNSEVVKRNKDDPLRITTCTPRFGAEGLKAREEGFNLADKITIPVILQQSEEDLILIPEKNKEFFENIASEDKTFKMYPGLYHEPFEDPGGEEFMADMFAWLDERAG
ncbi:MAG: alpha/beta hydrolase [Candidatus Thorarchaeota archaeon]|jgi:alpha-beta hydrolase superfamily lysophospholipase